ncbi:transmembrane protein 272-like [Gopherus evgoodei]|nr:transmembrane protein 272-like [Gopherus evgoodei]XP_030402852.1 transmembrane protein 272-like [Gopherus evgoodei]
MAEDPDGSRAPLLPGTAESPVHPALNFLGKVVVSALPIASIVIGALYLGQCPSQHLLPYYLLVGGSTVLLFLLLSCLPCGDGTDPPQLSPGARGWRALFLLFLFAWFIAGNVWVYSIYPPEYKDPHNPKFCHQLLYLFAFWVTTLVYVGLGVALLAALGILGCLLLLRARLPWLQRGDGYP